MVGEGEWCLALATRRRHAAEGRTLAQLDGATRSLEIELGPESLAELDRIWPGPRGPAPEAYAW